MADLIAIAMDGLTGILGNTVSRTVLIRRGTQWTEVSATLGRTVVAYQNEFGVSVRVESRDYLIKAADYKIGGIQVEPQAGDFIEDDNEDDGRKRTWEVMGTGTSEAWRYTDRYRLMLRLHTKRIAEAAV